MMTVRRSDERGKASHGWLNSRFTFSFAEYYDPAQMGFRALRVINEDRVEPGTGFGTHGHKEMEIVTWVLEGALRHQDSTGGGGVLRAGELQHMTAGTGIRHSEFNASESEPVHFLQIWVQPNRRDVPPEFDQRRFAVAEEPNRLHRLASPHAHEGGREGSLSWHADGDLFAGRLEPGHSLEHRLSRRHGWVQMARGAAVVNGQSLARGDGMALTEETVIQMVAGEDGAEALVFELD